MHAHASVNMGGAVRDLRELRFAVQRMQAAGTTGVSKTMVATIATAQSQAVKASVSFSQSSVPCEGRTRGAALYSNRDTSGSRHLQTHTGCRHARR